METFLPFYGKVESMVLELYLVTTSASSPLGRLAPRDRPAGTPDKRTHYIDFQGIFTAINREYYSYIYSGKIYSYYKGIFTYIFREFSRIWIIW